MASRQQKALVRRQFRTANAALAPRRGACARPAVAAGRSQADAPGRGAGPTARRRPQIPPYSAAAAGRIASS
jgi:hypothetical protein